MSIPRLGTLPAGARGFDCNTTVTPEAARLMKAAHYDFVVRYVRRSQSHTYDITTREVIDILHAGLALMLVQHVGQPGWHPTKVVGSSFGAVAAMHARDVGYPKGGVLWCDLEGVDDSATEQDVINYCNSWFDAVLSYGFDPGLYVGDRPGLSAYKLYWKTKFRRFWGAYNLNRDMEPLVRGIQMKQLPYPEPSKRVHGIPFKYDEDVIRVDALGSTPILLLP